MDSLYLLIPIALVFCALAIKLLLWAIGSGQYDDLDSASIRILNGHDRWVLTVTISPDSRWLVSGSDDQTLKRWDLKNNSVPQFSRGAEPPRVEAIHLVLPDRDVLHNSPQCIATKLRKWRCGCHVVARRPSRFIL